MEPRLLPCVVPYVVPCVNPVVNPCVIPCEVVGKLVLIKVSPLSTHFMPGSQVGPHEVHYCSM